MIQLSNLNVKPARNGSRTAVATLTNGARFYLHSVYDPEQEAEDWLKQFELQAHTAYVVWGFGLGYHVQALLRKLPDHCIIICVEYRPDQSLAAAMLKQFPQQMKWSKDPRVHALCNPQVRNIAATVNNLMRRHSIKRVTICRHYPAMMIHPEFFADLELNFTKNLREFFRIQEDFETSGIAEKLRNMWSNLPYFCANNGIAAFHNAFENIPAIIVSAGPSLNKNIELLKDLKNRALIIASGTAIGALHKHGIRPHFLAILDPSDKMYKGVKDFLHPDITLVVPPVVHADILQHHSGPIVTYQPDNLSQDYPGPIRKLLPPTAVLAANFSVATAAFAFALFSGANPILCVGQDLAYTAESHHAEGVRATDMSKVTPRENMIFVPGYYGDMVQTDLMFKDIIAYLGITFAAFPNRLFINATEGGAFIPGAQHQPLREAAESYLSREQDIQSRLEELLAAQPDCKTGELKDLLVQLQQDLTEYKDQVCQSFSDFQERYQTCLDDQSLRQLTGDMRTFMEGIETHAVYPYIQSFIKPILQMLDYGVQDHPGEEYYYLAGLVVLNNLRGMLTELSSLLEKVLAELAANH